MIERFKTSALFSDDIESLILIRSTYRDLEKRYRWVMEIEQDESKNMMLNKEASINCDVYNMVNDFVKYLRKLQYDMFYHYGNDDIPKYTLLRLHIEASNYLNELHNKICKKFDALVMKLIIHDFNDAELYYHQMNRELLKLKSEVIKGIANIFKINIIK